MLQNQLPTSNEMCRPTYSHEVEFTTVIQELVPFIAASAHELIPGIHLLFIIIDQDGDTRIQKFTCGC